ncbi:hypothetical protein C4901_06490 [Acidiferrobacter sp. SPIII_3]|uniref:nucleotidyl transferase AbiEii/AbiGii toxin family protein n=1 Tax=Acidiferrobacter sp. SPIII_3 TaxID=1281578 RepID=UPI000D72C524|nr:hypothetical protein C4901_06490 [Acidiferrobacter sp. SPIII_3]
MPTSASSCRRAGSQIGAHIIFCGGTALSQAHGVIERMSEDADFRIVVPVDDQYFEAPRARARNMR